MAARRWRISVSVIASVPSGRCKGAMPSAALQRFHNELNPILSKEQLAVHKKGRDAEYSAGDTAESLQKRADQALYDAKRNGKGRVVARPSPFIRDLVQGRRGAAPKR